VESKVTLLNKIYNIILNPRQEWYKIKDEKTTSSELFIQYAAVLAIIPAISAFIGYSINGYHIFGFSIKAPISWGIILAVVIYILNILNVLVSTSLIYHLSKSISIEIERINLFKLIVYSQTLNWLFGVTYIFPTTKTSYFMIFLFILVFSYNLYILYLGCLPLLGLQKDKASSYLILSGIILFIIVFLLEKIVFMYNIINNLANDAASKSFFEGSM
jgi:hypothetical protein